MNIIDRSYKAKAFLPLDSRINFGRNIKLGDKTYAFIKIDGSLTNYDEGKKEIISNRFKQESVRDMRITHESANLEMVPFSIDYYNSLYEKYEPAEFRIFVPKEDAEDFKQYILSNTKDPVPQIIPDEHFIVQEPGKCLDACITIVKNFDSNAIIPNNAWALATYNGTENIYIHKECYQMAIQAMDRELESGRPVIVGVDYLGKARLITLIRVLPTTGWLLTAGDKTAMVFITIILRLHLRIKEIVRN